VVDCRQAPVAFLSFDCPINIAVYHALTFAAKSIDLGVQRLDVIS